MKTSNPITFYLKLFGWPAGLLLLLNGCAICYPDPYGGPGCGIPAQNPFPGVSSCVLCYSNGVWVFTDCRTSTVARVSSMLSRSSGSSRKQGPVDPAVPVAGSVWEVLGLDKNLYLGRIFGTGVTPGRLQPGDFNEDGHTDFVGSGSQTSFFFGSGDGRFPFTTVSNLNSLQGAAVADLSGDTHLDLVLLGNNKKLTVLLGNGNGTFGDPATHTLAQSASIHAVADLNADGHPDVVVVPYSGDLPVFLGSAGGTLNPVASVPRPDLGMSQAVLVDLTGDDRAELIWSNSGDSRIRILSGIGTGALGNVIEVDVGETYASAPTLAVADLNQDNRPDLAAGKRTGGNGQVTIVTNAGGSSFVVEQHIELEGAYYGVAALEILDLNGNGTNDLVAQFQETAAGTTCAASALEADGAGGYVPRVLFEHLAVQPGRVLDLTGDGRADGAFPVSQGMIALKGQADGRIESPSRMDIQHGSQSPPKRLAADDLDGDGAIDLVNQGGGVLFNLGDGRFEEMPLLEDAGLLYQLARDVAVADLDGDNDREVLILLGSDRYLTTNAVRVFIQEPTRTFTNFVDYPTGPQPVLLQVADLNADQHPDAVTLNRPAPGTPSVTVLLGGSAGALGGPVTTLLPDLPDALYPERLALGDVTGDGRLDILVLSRAVNLSRAAHVTVLANQAAGGFTAREPLRLGGGQVGVGASVAGDFNNDGQTDVAVLQTVGSASEITLFLADGRGGFSQGPSRPASRLAPTYLTVADVDRDGALDLIGSGNSGVTIYAGSGTLGFPLAEDYFLNGVSGDFITFADLNGDQWPEWIAGEDKLDVRLNRASAGDYLIFSTLMRRLTPRPGSYPFRGLFEDHGLELAQVVVDGFDVYQRACQERQARFNEMLEAWLAFVRGQPSDLTITREAVDDANALLDELARRASPALASDLATERTALNDLEVFVGLPLQQAFTLLGLQEQLTILSVSVDARQVRIGIDRGPGGQFVLERADSLATSNWQPVAGTLDEVVEGYQFLLDPVRPTQGGFYRVRESVE